MKNMFLLYVTVLLFSIGCKKERGSTKFITEPCLVDSTFTIHYKYPSVGDPKFNPNNSNEFAFTKNSYFSICCKTELVIFNIENNEERVIYQGSPSFIDWSLKDWIIFQNNDDNKIYKIRSSGDSLTQLTNDVGQRPNWSGTGDKFIYKHSESIATTYGIKICSENGEILQTYPKLTAFYDTWQHDSLFAFAYNTFPDNGILSLNTFTQGKLPEGPYHPSGGGYIINGGGARGCEWMDNETLIVASSKGIFRVSFSNNFQDFEVFQIKESPCPLNDIHAVGYSSPSISKQTKQILLKKTEHEITGEKEAIRTTRFVRMNLDGTNEEIIEIPGL